MTDRQQPLFPLPQAGRSGGDSEAVQQHSSYPRIGAGGYPVIGPPQAGAATQSTGVAPPARSGASRRMGTHHVAVIVVALFAVAALVTVAVTVLVFNRSGGKSTASGQSHKAGGSSSVSVNDVTACSKSPDLQVESMNFGPDGLVLNTSITPDCADGDLLSNSRFQIALSDSAGHDVASGLFDLSTNPIAIGSNGTSRQFVFPAGTYWRTADSISGSLSMQASGLGDDAAVFADKPAAAITAVGVGAPVSGNLDAAAHSALVDIVAADAPFIEAHLLDAWQPQLSSKRPGLFADGITWSAPDVVREHMQLRQRFPGARLIWAGDWPVYSTPDWWITLSGVPFGNGVDANDWCAAQGFDGDHCFAKIVSRTMGTSGTTMLR